MRVQFMVWGWPTHFYPLVPLAWACRAAGHDVVVLTQPDLVPVVRRSGLPAVPVGAPVDLAELRRGQRYLAGPDPCRPLEWADLRQHGVWNVAPYQVIATKMLADSVRVTRRWRPDLIVFESTTFAGPMVSAMTGVPAVRHTWGVDYPYLSQEFVAAAMAPFCEALKVERIDTLGAASVDPCPASIQLGPTPEVDVPVRRLWMSYVPYNGTAGGFGERWVLRRRGRPRVAVTWGVTTGALYQSMSYVDDVVAALGGLDAEVVVAVGASAEPPRLPGNAVVVRGMALQYLLPACDLLVSQGGMGTVMTAMRAGTPNLVVPSLPDQLVNGRQLAGAGAARSVPYDPEQPGEILRHAREMLADPGYAAAAARLRDESAAAPSPARVVESLVRIA